jgi:hypothetical protein
MVLPLEEIRQISDGPLEKAETEAEILAHRWPTAADFDFTVLREECTSHSERVIIGGLWTGIMGDSFRTQ